jgi:hypothetical protein
MSAGGNLSIETAAGFVVGWSGVNESDLLPGGDPEPVEFDAELFAASNCGWSIKTWTRY